MEKSRYILLGMVLGIILGAGAAPAFTTGRQSVARSADGTVWTPMHAAIPAREEGEPSPTF